MQTEDRGIEDKKCGSPLSIENFLGITKDHEMKYIKCSM